MPDTTPIAVSQNRILAALPDSARQRLAEHLEPISLSAGEVIYEAHQQLSHIYFPTSAVVSLLYTMENGSSSQIGVVGNDGAVGVAVFMGGETSPSQAVVQCAGEAWRLAMLPFRSEFATVGDLHRLLLLYTQALVTQMSQTAVCNRLHSVEQQLCRWLLLSHDRIPGDDLAVTQETIANALGVRRAGVSVAAHALQDLGIIRYRRGRMSILDRSGLEDRVCECYRVVKTECDRLFE
jgi:CRP-like cAMP-binding protein